LGISGFFGYKAKDVLWYCGGVVVLGLVVDELAFGSRWSLLGLVQKQQKCATSFFPQ
jgi:hypothetical protein